MSTGELLRLGWDWDPTVVLGCVALVGAYLVALRGRLTWEALPFGAGVLVLLLALVSPIDTLGDTYLFSAHMLQHLLLVLVVPPLLLLGIPRGLAERLLAWAPASRAERICSQPLGAWVLATGTLWVWHVPALYDAALANEGIHILEHLCFLVTATVFWWPVVTPLGERRFTPWVAVVYLVGAVMANSLLGIIITFAPPGLYPPYLHPAGAPAVLHLVRDGWGLSVGADQQMAGVLMWIPGNLAYLAGMAGLMTRWFDEPDEESLPAADLRRSNAT